MNRSVELSPKRHTLGHRRVRNEWTWGFVPPSDSNSCKTTLVRNKVHLLTRCTFRTLSSILSRQQRPRFVPVFRCLLLASGKAWFGNAVSIIFTCQRSFASTFFSLLVRENGKSILKVTKILPWLHMLSKTTAQSCVSFPFYRISLHDNKMSLTRQAFAMNFDDRFYNHNLS